MHKVIYSVIKKGHLLFTFMFTSCHCICKHVVVSLVDSLIICTMLHILVFLISDVLVSVYLLNAMLSVPYMFLSISLAVLGEHVST